MALTFVKLFAPVQLGVAAAVIYTCPATPNTSVLKNGRVKLANTTGAPVTATLYAVPSGGAPSTANMFYPATSIAAGASVDVDIPSLAAGDMLQGLAGAAASITIHEEGGVLYS